MYTVGVIYMKTEAEVDRAFAYAKRVGVNLIIGVPGYDLLQYTEKKVREYNIRMAIHNHGPEDKLYPAPKDVYDRISKMDRRMGLCLDVGHAFRAGAKPEKAIIDYAERIFDLHIKDVTAPRADGKAIELGRGAIDFVALIDALRQIGYKGACSIEFEKRYERCTTRDCRIGRIFTWSDELNKDQFAFSLFTRSIYSCIAASLVFPFMSSHASCLALATKSKGLDGGSAVLSPSVDCLYKE